MDFSNSLSSISPNIMANYVLNYITKEELLLLLSYERIVLVTKEFIVSLLNTHPKLCDKFAEPLESYEEFYDYYVNDRKIPPEKQERYESYEKDHDQNIKHKRFCQKVWSMIQKQVYIIFPTVPAVYVKRQPYTLTMTAEEFYSSK